ncbi:NAD(P)H-dependent oxidoreductase [Paenibacillus glycanilyticus]|uniref:NAD(P)H-dependent oxidoreductase n=1 Tax=Paenibacillus glycanilyticus TaxID=126569 RepID=UPI0020401AA5|nr:NAD(P)H-dependent oxidoreductase [Paenibacillus glycanilyticus]MCM3630058.1 NAD(P)H-dependent oxidoreductase [Paenibacillus glycanilyticus]
MNNAQKKKEVLDAFAFRHATKEFDPNRKVSDEDFQFILETGRLSPSSVGFEAWKFLVVQNQEIRMKIREVAFGGQGQLPTASHLIILLARKDVRYDSEYVEYIYKNIKGLSDEAFKTIPVVYKDFQENDLHILDNERTLIDWSSKQTYIPLANMMTAAAQIGIDSCPMEGFNKEKVTRILKDAGVLNDELYELSVMVAFGYRVSEPRFPQVRRPMDEVVEWIH